MAARLVSLVLLLAVWIIASHLAGARMLPDPQAVAAALVDEWRSGALPCNRAATLMRVLVAFIVAMAIGSCAPAMAVFISTPSAPSSIAKAASDAVPTPASTITGTRENSRMMRMFFGF